MRAVLFDHLIRDERVKEDKCTVRMRSREEVVGSAERSQLPCLNLDQPKASKFCNELCVLFLGLVFFVGVEVLNSLRMLLRIFLV